MANALTGDFEAVLQLCGRTLNRLLASMHQNAGANPNIPSFPHSVGFRVGDHGGKFRGRAWAQLSVPRIELLDGEDDRFRLEVSLRSRFVPDPGTASLPGLIHGTVRADYQIESVDRGCPGWAQKAVDHIWIKVIEDSVSFQGTAFADNSTFDPVRFLDDALVNSSITKLIIALLKTEFQASPHKVDGSFGLDSMRSLNDGKQSAVVVPMGFTNERPAGRLNSVKSILLDGSDFAIGVSREYILSRIQPRLDNLKTTFREDFRFNPPQVYIDLGWAGDIDLLNIDVYYRVALAKAQARWLGGTVSGFVTFDSLGLIEISIAGSAVTNKPELNVDFQLTQIISLVFDPATEKLSATAIGSPSVNVDVHGNLGFLIKQYATARIQSLLSGQMQNLVAGLGSGVDLRAQKEGLKRQLVRLDDQCDARFERVTFSPDGLVLKGGISVTRRRKPVGVLTQMAEGDGFTAFLSWMPGGRIDTFEWSWRWSFNEGSPGAQTLTDRFLLRRPGSPGRGGKFGFTQPSTTPLPGLDGSGQICVNVKGVQMDPVTGDMVGVETGRQCIHFKQSMRLHADGIGRVFLREYDPPRRDPSGPVVERGLIQLETGRPASGGSNTLVVYVDERWDEETEATLRGGLSDCTREDAGLLVLVLFPEARLGGAGDGLTSRVAELAESLQAPVLVNEDVRGGWAGALSLPSGSGGPAWRLLSPGGGVTWMHDGRLDAQALADALDDGLFASAAPDREHLASGLGKGTLVSHDALAPSLRDMLASDCPPPPFARLGAEQSVVTFVQRGSTASEDALDQLRRRFGGDTHSDGDATFVAIVVDGADDAEADELVRGITDGFAVVPDRDGAVAGRFGIRVWPTTVTLNQVGMVTGFEMGADLHAEPEAGARTDSGS